MSKSFLAWPVLALALVTGATPAEGQEASREEVLARELLEVSGAGEMGLQVVQQMARSFSAANPDVPQEFWDRFVAGGRSSAPRR